MKKKKKIIKEYKVPETKKEENPVENFTIGKWKGLPHYQCNLCSFETLSLPNMQAHIAEKHTETKSVIPGVVVKRDRFGNLIEKKEG